MSMCDPFIAAESSVLGTNKTALAAHELLIEECFRKTLLRSFALQLRK